MLLVTVVLVINFVCRIASTMEECTGTLIVDQLRQRLLKHASDLEVGTVATSLIQHDVVVTLDMLVQCCDIISLETLTLPSKQQVVYCQH